MTTGSVAPAEIENPQSHLNGMSGFALAAADAAGAPLGAVTAGVQAAAAIAAAPFSRDRRPSVALIDPPARLLSRYANRCLSERDSACSGARGQGARGG